MLIIIKGAGGDFLKFMQPRDYQISISDKAADIIRKYGLVYLAMQVRCGKTVTALLTGEKVGAGVILFLTKKKVISGILEDHKQLGLKADIIVTNYENLHHVKQPFDIVIIDEAHSCFLENTLIDGVKIKDIKVGDFIKSINFASNKIEKRKVLNVFKNKLTENLVKIKCNGKEIICTESHKIYTKRGWVKAIDIRCEDELLILQ